MTDSHRTAGSSDVQRIDLLIVGAAQVVTCADGSPDRAGCIQGGLVAVAGERIVAVGNSSEVADRVDASGARVLQADGQVVAPGFVDCHTHLVFGGSRSREYAARMTMSAAEVRALGIPTGIQATVAQTRAATADQLASGAAARLRRMLEYGTTTVESKSGYGLSLAAEMKQLEVNRRLAADQCVDVVSTFLGAHDFPPELSRDAYLDLLIRDLIPAVAGRRLAQFCDVYCDTGYYTADETRAILQAGESVGLRPKVHVDAYSDIGGALVAAELGAVSADHLNYTSRTAMGQLAAAGVVGVVMPALDFAVAHPRPFDARAMREAGMTLALATDLCPACWCESMQLVMQLACRLYGFTPAEALVAATLNGARAVGLESDRGSLEEGKLADIQIWDVPSFEEVIYRLGHNSVATVIKRGQVRVSRPATG